MPVDRNHAFAGGPVYGRPSPRSLVQARHARFTAWLRAARAYREFRRNSVLAEGCRFGAAAWCLNSGSPNRIQLGSNSVCRGLVRREPFGDGSIVIGEEVYIGDDCIISCCDRVEIGDRTLLGHGVQVFDNNSHPIDHDKRVADWRAIRENGERDDDAIAHAPVRIGSGVWLGFGATVLRGVTIGDGAVVAAASVVTESVEPYAVVGGNPLRTIGQHVLS
jgi:acetyltransferase-like isoleucine patch superfamily enzyme